MKPQVDVLGCGRAVLEVLIATLLGALLVCGNASAQGVDSDASTNTNDHDASVSTGDPLEPSDAPDVRDVTPPTPASPGRPARVALNLQVAGWLTAGASVPALALSLRFLTGCSFARPGLFPGITFGVGISFGIVGAILRARRLRGQSRPRLMQRQSLFRTPALRGLGFLLVPMATVPATTYSAFVPYGRSCTD